MQRMLSFVFMLALLLVMAFSSGTKAQSVKLADNFDLYGIDSLLTVSGVNNFYSKVRYVDNLNTGDMRVTWDYWEGSSSYANHIQLWVGIKISDFPDSLRNWKWTCIDTVSYGQLGSYTREMSKYTWMAAPILAYQIRVYQHAGVAANILRVNVLEYSNQRRR